MEDLETPELVHALDRRTYFRNGQAEGIEILKARGVEYRPYAEREGESMMTASLEAKRVIDRWVLPKLLAELPKMPLIEERFEQGYFDVKLYPHSELSYDQDGEGALFVNVVFVLGVPPNDRLDTLSRNSIVACFEPLAWQEPHDAAFKEAMCDALNGDKIIGMLNNISFEGFSTSSLESLRWSLEVDGCRAAHFMSRERESRGLPATSDVFFLVTELDEDELWTGYSYDEREAMKPERRQALARSSEHFKMEKEQLVALATHLGLEDGYVELSAEATCTKCVLRGRSPWTIYDFDEAMKAYSAEHGLYFELTDLGAMQVQSYMEGEYDEGSVGHEDDWNDEEWREHVRRSAQRWEPLFSPLKDDHVSAQWSTPNIEFEMPEITHENAAETVPALICKKAEALGIKDLDPSKLTSSTHLYRLMGCDEAQTQALEDSLAEHFGEEPFFKWITVAQIVEVAKIAIWPV